MELYFCISLQRSGNTLLGSILNQNPDVTLTANSPLTEIILILKHSKQNMLLIGVIGVQMPTLNY